MKIVIDVDKNLAKSLRDFAEKIQAETTEFWKETFDLKHLADQIENANVISDEE